MRAAFGLTLLAGILALCASVRGADAMAPAGAVDQASIAQLRAWASGGSAEAQYALAQRYATASGTPMDKSEALRLISAAAAQGLPKAEYALARRYAGESGEVLDPVLAAAYTRKAAEHGHGPAQVDLGFAYFNGNLPVAKDLALSFQWFKKAAHGGSIIAQCMLGDFYAAGLGGVRQDHAEAFKWYQRTAIQADRCAPKSQFALYLAYESGKGVRRDLKTATLWLRRAAAAGNPQAQATLAHNHETGHGVSRDLQLATAWRKKSREGVSAHEDHGPEDDSRRGGAGPQDHKH